MGFHHKRFVSISHYFYYWDNCQYQRCLFPSNNWAIWTKLWNNTDLDIWSIRKIIAWDILWLRCPDSNCIQDIWFQPRHYKKVPTHQHPVSRWNDLFCCFVRTSESCIHFCIVEEGHFFDYSIIVNIPSLVLTVLQLSIPMAVLSILIAAIFSTVRYPCYFYQSSQYPLWIWLLEL